MPHDQRTASSRVRPCTFRSLARCAAGLLAVALVLPNVAAAYDAIYAFGDSLSDVGNNFARTGGANPASPYFNGQYSNGNVWLQTLASDLGVAPLTPSQLGGTDYAYGGAGSGTTLFHTATNTDVTGSSGQIAQFQATHPTADANALYTIWIGGADLLGLPDNATNAQLTQALGQTVGNIDSAINSLAGAGAKNFLVMTIPDLGKFPGAVAAGPATSAAASAGTATFNNLLVQSLSPAPAGTHISVFDTFALYDQVIADPGAYGITNTTLACWTGTFGGGNTGTECATPNQYVFWDSLHPTGPVHALIGNGAAAVLPAVPLPGGAPLLVSALGLMGLRRRKS